MSSIHTDTDPDVITYFGMGVILGVHHLSDDCECKNTKIKKWNLQQSNAHFVREMQ